MEKDSDLENRINEIIKKYNITPRKYGGETRQRKRIPPKQKQWLNLVSEVRKRNPGMQQKNVFILAKQIKDQMEMQQ